MAWTVPNGCAYASVYPNWVTWTVGQSVPDSVAPNTMSYTGAGSGFVLVDFTNGYIYSNVSSLTLTISGNTFTVKGPGGYTNDVYIIASDRALSYRFMTLAGDTFTFGDGSNIRDKFTNSSWEYTLMYGFYGRDDITSVTIPNGIGHPNDLMYAFTGCTNLQTVNGTLTQLSNATRAFSGCSSLTTLPTFPLNSTASFESAFYNCSSLTTAPTIPNGVTNITNCFYGCSSLTTVPTLPSTITNMQGAFYNCSSLTTAPTIPNGVTNIANCFNRCSSLTTVPALPNTITAMQGAFMYCTALTTTPTIPSAVTNMQQCFNGCTSLVTASTIPANVTNTKWCFYNCAELTGAITIDASPTDITEMFTGTVKEIVLFGTGSINSIANNYNNVYVWSLSQTMTAVRSTPTTTVDISVDVSRYNVGNLVSLKLYKDNASTPLVVTWNDPTLAVTTNPTTFTTSVTGIADGDPTSFTVIATDIYGFANATTVNVPITFYTMDVQAGGKEIAFGTAADDDVTNYPEGLFKCAMSFKLKDNLFWVGTRSEYEQAVSDDKMPEHTIVFITDETADYVVEQGTSGIWTYRKWNSGVAECWGNSTGSIPSGWSSSGITINLPFTFLTVTESFVQFRNWQVARGYTSITATNATSVNIQTNADSAVAGSFSVDVKGTWK